MKDLLNLRHSITNRTLELISFGNLWHLYNPGDIIIHRETAGQDNSQAYQVYSVTGGRYSLKAQFSKLDPDKEASPFEWVKPNQLLLQCLYLDFDGVSIGPKEKLISISPYVGEKRIVDLDYFPKEFCRQKDSAGFIERLVNRGHMFLDFRYGYGRYEGMTARYDPEQVYGEVFVDFKSGYEGNPHWKKHLGEFNDFQLLAASINETYEPRCHSRSCTSCPSANFDDNSVDTARCSRFKSGPKFPGVMNEGFSHLEDNYLMLLPQHLLAYSLNTKTWSEFQRSL